MVMFTGLGPTYPDASSLSSISSTRISAAK